MKLKELRHHFVLHFFYWGVVVHWILVWYFGDRKKKNLKLQLTLCAKSSYHVKEYKISEDYSCSVHVANLFTHGLL